jgi:hypothetical protein
MTVDWDIQGLINRTEDRAARGNRAIAEWVRGEAVRLIELKPKHGTLYSGAPYRINLPDHKASAPGEAPADDTGALKNSGAVQREDGIDYSVTFGDTVAYYARDLEYGDGEKLAARPFLRPATVAGKKKATELMQQELFK